MVDITLARVADVEQRSIRSCSLSPPPVAVRPENRGVLEPRLAAPAALPAEGGG